MMHTIVTPDCAACHRYESDPTRRSWTQHNGHDYYICLACRPAVLERGLNAIAYCRDETKAGR